MHVIPARYFSSVPPGFEGLPLLYVTTIFSLMLISLLSLEWMWRLTWSMFERPTTIRHPVTAMRWIYLLILTGGLMRVAPNLVYMVLWNDLTPQGRQLWFQIDALMDTCSFVPFSSAWLLGYLGGPMILYQLLRHPLPLHLVPTWRQFARPLKIGTAIMTISLAIVYLQ